uniref:Uncharacterized protein n=1 Tax=Anguilla anguilla TaxID=7936 RepID=A0A0E9XA60_ANGAN
MHPCCMFSCSNLRIITTSFPSLSVMEYSLYCGMCHVRFYLRRLV